jgi:hypothetical protein
MLVHYMILFERRRISIEFLFPLEFGLKQYFESL